MAEQKREHFSDKPAFLPDLRKWADDPATFASRRGFSVLDRASLTNVQLEDKSEDV